MLRLTLATRNAHKAREFAQILGPDFVVLDLAGNRDLPLIEETGHTFEENAILKAIAASAAVDGWVMADDSGLEVAALGGAPGVRSARYAGDGASDSDNVAKLLAALATVDGESRAARFRCALALAEEGKLRRVFHGAIGGLITTERRGESGFGYDPIFVPIGYSQTFSELGGGVKNHISHRAQAIAQLRDYLRLPRQ